MISMRSRGLWLLVLGALTGLLALGALTAVALAGTADHSGSLSMSFPMPYASVLEAVRAVCADGAIRGTAQYENEAALSGAKQSPSSGLFPPWAGAGEAFYKTRAGAIAPAHFAGSKDRGAVTVRYVVAPGTAGGARVTIESIFEEDSHHGRHPSQGFVEKAEFDEIARLLKNAGVPGNGVAAEARGGEQEQKQLAQAVEPERPAPAATEGQSAALGRTYAVGEDDLKKALQKLGAFDDAALPALEGFAALGVDAAPRYDRPYYRFRVAFEAAGAGRITVRMEAVVTARFTDPAGSRPEYRSVPSNGRLETDLFDRLDDFMRSAAAGAPVSSGVGAQQESVRSAGNK
jgi:hypothetical protein